MTDKAEVTSVVVGVTAFDRDGKLDFEGYRRHLARIAAAGNELCVGGSGTEEGHVLGDVERRDLVTVAQEVASEHKVGLRLNCREPRQASAILAELELAQATGCSAIHVPILDVGHGYLPSATELRDYLKDALSQAQVPVVLSTSVVMHQVFPLDLVRFAVSELGVSGIVCAPPGLSYLGELIEMCRPSVQVYLAGAPQLANGLALGASGFLSPEGNISPDACRLVATGWRDGIHGDFRRGLGALVKLSATLSDFGAAVGIKAALRALGLADFWVRPPRRDLSQEQVEAIRPRLLDALKASGFNAE